MQFTIGTPKLTENAAGVIDDLYRDRIRTLLSVDDLVEAVVNTLEVSLVFYNNIIPITAMLVCVERRCSRWYIYLL